MYVTMVSFWLKYAALFFLLTQMHYSEMVYLQENMKSLSFNESQCEKVILDGFFWSVYYEILTQ